MGAESASTSHHRLRPVGWDRGPQPDTNDDAVLDLHAVTVQMATPAECPDWPTLLAWLEGELADQQMRRVGTHVPDCSVCRARLSLLDVVQRVVERQD